MALSPIQIYQQQQNPLAQILQGGNQTITGIFDKAIQIGRDMSNKQLQQEQDMMAMRNTETAMAQRRAENLQQNNEDAMKFARSAFESDRRFGVDQTQQQFLNQRTTAQDLFGNQLRTNADVRAASADTRAANADVRAGEDQTLQMNAVEAEKSEAAERAARIRALLSENAGSSPGGTTGGGLGALGLESTVIPNLNKTSPAARDERQIAVDMLADTNSTAAERDLAMRFLYPKGTKPEGDDATKTPSEAELRARTTASEKAMEEKVLGNTTAFKPQAAVMQGRAADATKYNDPTKNPTGAELVEAEIYDKNRFISEKSSARRMTLPKYLSKGPKDAASQKAREELWNFVNVGGGGSAPSASTPGTATTSAEDDLNKLLGD